MRLGCVICLSSILIITVSCLLFCVRYLISGPLDPNRRWRLHLMENLLIINEQQSRLVWVSLDGATARGDTEGVKGAGGLLSLCI